MNPPASTPVNTTVEMTAGTIWLSQRCQRCNSMTMGFKTKAKHDGQGDGHDHSLGKIKKADNQGKSQQAARNSERSQRKHCLASKRKTIPDSLKTNARLNAL